MYRTMLPYRTMDGKKFVMAYGIDITELKKSRDELLGKNAELEKLNGELDSLVYSVTHDLRSPVLSVMGLLDVASETSDVSNELRNYMGLMRQSVRGLDDTIREILNYSRNSRVELNFSLVDLNSMVFRIFESVRFYVNYNIGLYTEFTGSVPLYSDESRIKPLMNNLISNAVKYSRENGGNAYVKVSVHTDDEKCVISVEDNGEGIPYAHQDKVFKIFHRASNSTTGSGLGLFICSEIVKKLNGDIALVSTPGKGTSFTVTIPNNIKHLELTAGPETNG
jgi:signal transduction histidine kinase